MNKSIFIDLAAPALRNGVRCSWERPGGGGVQFRVSDHSPSFGPSNMGKVPTAKHLGAKEKGNKPRS